MNKLIALVLCVLTLGCAQAKADIPVVYTADMIDLDFAALSGTVVYAQVYNMAGEPEAYVGKIVKIRGYFDCFQDRETGMVYTSCIIPDATACCAQGLEFIWTGEHSFPEDYPEPGADLTVTGRFETYIEDDWMYIHLVDAEVDWETES